MILVTMPPLEAGECVVSERGDWSKGNTFVSPSGGIEHDQWSFISVLGSGTEMVIRIPQT
jgi:hypothetical protein